ncbi:MAG: hypothetical protein H7Y27_01655 [Gemmatimonadaceae bacterium]|nr:hypothetical protein [Chitinophagaceae bacterium]
MARVAFNMHLKRGLEAEYQKRHDEIASLDELPEEAIMQKLWKYMADIMDINPENSPVSIPLKEVFYLP